MARKRRSEVFEPNEVGVYHCMNRIVRRSFLCGWDPVTKKDYSHRKKWFLEKLKELARPFAIDVMAHTILSNHFHLVLRNRPDQVSKMSDEEVATRWLLICPPSNSRSRHKGEKMPSEVEIRQLSSDPEVISELRQRLSNPSWLLRQLCQYMGIRCNAEDELTGHFWESRFKMCRLLDEAAVLACLAYVDLNPIRAGLVSGLKEYPYVSISERLRTLDGEIPDPSSWLAPLEVFFDEYGLVGSPKAQKQRRVAIDLGTEGEFQGQRVEISTRRYQQLLEWLALQVRSKAAGEDREQLDTQFQSEPPLLLHELGIEVEGFAEAAFSFQECFSGAAGCPQTLAGLASNSSNNSRRRTTPNSLQLRRLPGNTTSSVNSQTSDNLIRDD